MDKELTVENIIKYFDETPGFSKHNKLHIEELSKEKAIISAEITEDSLNPSGIVHGGLVFGLADTAMGTVAYLTGRKVVTVDSNINYLKPTTGSKVTCVAEPIKVGKTLGVYKADIFDGRNDLTATVTGTYFFLDREIKK